MTGPIVPIPGAAIEDLAKAMIDIHGDDAWLEACQRGDEALAKSQEGEARGWAKVAEAILGLLAPSKTVH